MQTVTTLMPCVADLKGSTVDIGEGVETPRQDFISASAVVRNALGLHARPAAMLVRAASSFDCDISLSDGEDIVSAKSILGILALGAKQGTVIRLEADGNGASDAVMILKNLFEDGFGED